MSEHQIPIIVDPEIQHHDLNYPIIYEDYKFDKPIDFIKYIETAEFQNRQKALMDKIQNYLKSQNAESARISPIMTLLDQEGVNIQLVSRVDAKSKPIETDPNKLQDIVQNMEYHCPDKCALVHLYFCSIYPNKPSKYMVATLSFLQDVKTMHVIPIWVDAGLFPHRLSRQMKDQLQCEYRQKYLERVPEGEWMLILDSDEVLFGSIWSIPDTLIMANNIESHKKPEFMSIWEMRSDVQFKSRPRLIKKKKGITYISDVMKHDYIKYCTHEIEHEYEGVCQKTRNYIEVQDPIYENSWTLDFLTFAHYKRGIGLSLVSDGLIQFDDLPMNFKRLSDIEMRLEMETEQELRYKEYERMARD